MAIGIENPMKRRRDSSLPDIQIPAGPLAKASQRVKKPNTTFIRPPSQIPPPEAYAHSRGVSAQEIANASPQPETYLPRSMPTDSVRAINELGLNPGSQRFEGIDVKPNIKLVRPDPVRASINPDAGAGSATRFGGQRIVNPNGSTTTVFSDGSNGIPRTVSENQIKAAAGALNVVPVANLVNPLASDVTGHPVSTADMVNQRVANTPQTPRLVNPAFQQMAAAADAASVATGDWRSPLGTAAHNLRVEAGSGTPRNRRMAEDALKQLQAGVQQRAITAATEAGASQRNAMAQAGQTRRTGMQEAGANMRTSAQQRGASARTAAQLTQPVQVALPGGGLGIMNPRTGSVTPVQYGGKAVRSATLTAAQKHTQQLVEQLRADASKALAARQKNQLPGEDGKIAAPTPDDMRQILLNQAYVQGYAPQVNPKTGQIALNINGQQVIL